MVIVVVITVLIICQGCGQYFMTYKKTVSTDAFQCLFGEGMLKYRYEYESWGFQESNSKQWQRLLLLVECYFSRDVSCAMVSVVYFLGTVFIFKIVGFGNKCE